MSTSAGRIFPLLLFFISVFSSVHAQREATQEKLAIQYLDQKEYEKANVYLEILYDASPDRWYADYYRSLLNTQSYDAAEKLVKKHIRSHRHDVYLYVQLGHV